MGRPASASIAYAHGVKRCVFSVLGIVSVLGCSGGSSSDGPSSAAGGSANDAGNDAGAAGTSGGGSGGEGGVDDAGPDAEADGGLHAFTCPAHTRVCDGECRAIQVDPAACGDCDTRCADSEVCNAGSCMAKPVARACEPSEIDEVLAPATAGDPVVELACSLTLGADDEVTKRIRLLGSEASGVVLDCAGATLRKGVSAGGPDTVSVESRKLDEGSWDRPTDVTIRNCRIEGSLRIRGQGANGQDTDVTGDSHSEGHRERAQAAAPTRISLENLTLVGAGRIPLYLAPGVTRTTLRDSTIEGRSSSAVVYLDAESAHNRLLNNDFVAISEGGAAKRELLAVDGSADNVIAGNTLRELRYGGIFVYRNCGEGGAVRHQEPRRNLIVGNAFLRVSEALSPPIWVGSRNAGGFFKLWCDLDDGYDFGSSISDDDYARDTLIVDNRFEAEELTDVVRLDDEPTHLVDNVSMTPAQAGPARCVVFRDGKEPLLVAAGEAHAGLTCHDGWLR